MKYSAPKGVFDILPKRLLGTERPEWLASEVWQEIEQVIRKLTTLYGYSEIRTPIFERTELFHRGVGEGTDIVSKEIYSFLDKGKRSLALRPEGTAPVMRAVLEHHLHANLPFSKLFYIGPMFRYERPQSGRYRQHHQLGVEVIGLDAPEVDAEVIDLLLTFYRTLGIQELSVQLNTLGTPKCRKAFRDALIDFLTPHKEKLSEDSQRRLDTNPLRILDSKAEQDKEILQNAPQLEEYLSGESKAHFSEVCATLEALGIPYTLNPQLVRGLDYYNHTVFEVVTQSLGAQNSIGGGGRYDGLLKTLGGPSLPSIGWATGLERVIQTMLDQTEREMTTPGPQLYLVPLDKAVWSQALSLITALRRSGVHAEADFTGRKLKKTMSLANTLGAEHVVVLGENECSSGQVKVKHMKSGEETTLNLETFAEGFLSMQAEEATRS